MITSVLQMLVFAGSAVAFAWYVLRVDKRESNKKPVEDKQDKFYFAQDGELDREHRDAAMSRL